MNCLADRHVKVVLYFRMIFRDIMFNTFQMNFLTRLQHLTNVSVNLATKLAVIENVTREEILPRLTPCPLAGVDFQSSKDNEHIACILMMVYIIVFVKVKLKTTINISWNVNSDNFI